MTLVERGRLFTNRLLEYEFWLVGFAVLISIIWTSFLPFTLVISFSFWIMRGLNRGYLTIHTPSDLSIGLFCLMVFVSLIATTFPEKTIPQIFRALSGVLLFYAIVNWTNSKPRIRLVFLILILAGIILSLFAPFSVSWSTSKLLFIPGSIYERFAAIVSDTVHPNVMGGNLVLLLPLPLSILIFGWKDIRRGERIISGLAVVLMTIVIILTKSRGTWVALIAVLMLITVLRWRFGWIFIIFAAFFLIIAISFMGWPDFIEAITANDALIGIEGRIDIWSRAVFMIQDFPLTGTGFGMFMDVADKLYKFFLFSPGKIIHAHNLFLQIAVDVGLPGLITWIAIFLSFCLINWRIFRYAVNEGNTLQAGIGVGLLCSSVALAVHGITDAVTWGFIRTAPMVWAIWGVSVTIFYLQQYPAIYKKPISEG